LDLAVRDLGNGLASGSLDLTVRDLGDRLAGTGLDLTIRDLGDRLSSGGGGLELTVANLGGSAARGSSSSVEDVDVDRRALSTSGLIVEVVEGTAQALVEDSGVTNSKSAVAADGETRGVDGTGLGGLVELELVVGSNVTSAALVIGQGTILKSDSQDLGLARLEVTLAVGDVGDGDAERAGVVLRAAGRRTGLGGDGLGDALGEGDGSTSESSSNGEGLHIDGDKSGWLRRCSGDYVQVVWMLMLTTGVGDRDDGRGAKVSSVTRGKYDGRALG